MQIAMLLVDAMLLLLIWLVQIIIYPSFQYMEKERLLIWHSSYTQRITVFVLPLMFSQVALHGYQLFQEIDIITITSTFCTLIAWLVTFLKEVPLHNKIGLGEDLEITIQRLIKWNWPRTIAWSILFLITLFKTGTF